MPIGANRVSRNGNLGGAIPDSAIDDFESDSNGSQPQNWDSQYGQVTNQRSFSGSLSYETTSESNIPDLDYILGADVSKTTDGVVWQSYLYESSDSGGGAWRFENQNGDEITTTGTENPSQVSRTSSGTDRNELEATGFWFFHEITFDFTNDEFDVEYVRQDNGDTYTATDLAFVNSASEITRVELIRDSALGVGGANLREDFYTDDAGFTS